LGNAATAERRAGEGGRNGGVPLTFLKPKSDAIAPLVDSKRLGSDVIRAIDEMLVAEATIVGRMLPGALESAKLDRICSNDQRQDAVLEAQTNYLTFHEFWSIRAFLRGPDAQDRRKAVMRSRSVPSRRSDS